MVVSLVRLAPGEANWIPNRGTDGDGRIGHVEGRPAVIAGDVPLDEIDHGAEADGSMTLPSAPMMRARAAASRFLRHGVAA